MNIAQPATVPVDVIADRPEAPIVLMDFARFSGETTLLELMQEEASHRGLYRIDGVDAFASADGCATINEVAGACHASLVEHGVRPAGLIGYCSAANLTLRVADAFRMSNGRRPALALVDPIWPDPSLILADLAEALASLDAADSALSIDPALDLPSVLAVLRRELGRKLAADGTPDEEIDLCIDLMLGRYEAWFGFLFATMRTPVPEPTDRVLVLLSAERNRRVPPEWPAGRAIDERLPLSVQEMLSSTEVRRRLCAYVDGSDRPR
jgi:hypothetical protein